MPKISVTCPYCGNVASKVSGKAIYPHRPDLFVKKFYLCKPCKAYVGCHQKSEQPLGRLANAQLRRAKVDAHRAFDPLWQSGSLTRTSAYKWLAKQLNISEEECHIGMFDYVTCNRVIMIMANQVV